MFGNNPSAKPNPLLAAMTREWQDKQILAFNVRMEIEAAGYKNEISSNKSLTDEHKSALNNCAKHNESVDGK